MSQLIRNSSIIAFFSAEWSGMLQGIILASALAARSVADRKVREWLC
jgi:hypothetical protein